MGKWTVSGGTIGRINRLVIWGQIVGGSCLLLGLLTRTAAVAGAAMLGLFYLAMPPLPGLAGTAQSYSHFLYVDHNLIEALALLVLATTHSGRWAGLDAVLHKLVPGGILGIRVKEFVTVNLFNAKTQRREDAKA